MLDSLPEGGEASSGLQNEKIGRRRRRQFVHGKRAGPGAYSMYVRSTSTSRGQSDK